MGCACMRDMSKAYISFFAKHEEKRLLRRSSSTLEDNIKTDRKEEGQENENWSHIALL
jgi:hypothetical protein